MPFQEPDPLPGVLFQVSHARIECGPAPHLHRPITHLIYLSGDRKHVGGLKTRRQQGLMGIPQRCAGNQELSSLCLQKILLFISDVPSAMCHYRCECALIAAAMANTRSILSDLFS